MWGKFSYLISILIFCGTPLIIMAFYKIEVLIKYWKTMTVAVIFGLLFSLTEGWATSRNAWRYSQSVSFNQTFLGVEIESYVFSLIVPVVIAAAVIIWSDKEDKDNNST